MKWEEDKNNNKLIFYTGHSNGNIMKWDYKTSQVLLTLNVVSNKLSKKIDDNLIWCLSTIGDKFLASGDSNGKLRIWDSNYGVLIKEFAEHEADILSICQNKDKSKLYYTGSDSLVCSLQLVNEEWILTSKFRGQSHDINSLVLLNDECLLSGGMTTDICIYKLKDSRFVEKYDKKLSTSNLRYITI